MDFKEIKKLSLADLHKNLSESRQKIRELRFSVANNQLKNMREIRQVKLTVARILTVLKQQQNSVVKASPASIESDHKE